jgi:hypothetical protein
VNPIGFQPLLYHLKKVGKKRTGGRKRENKYKKRKGERMKETEKEKAKRRKLRKIEKKVKGEGRK